MTKVVSISEKRESLDLEFTELRAKSKPEIELFKRERFQVLNVLGTKDASDIYEKVDKIMVGGIEIKDEEVNKLLLTVKDEPGSNTGIEKILFLEDSIPVIRGNRIEVLIPKYTTKIIRKEKTGTIFYLERDYRKQEMPIEMSLLNDFGEIIRTQRLHPLYFAYKNASNKRYEKIKFV